jgi:diguanylate cyclase (GGDEF)-like protein
MRQLQKSITGSYNYLQGQAFSDIINYPGEPVMNVQIIPLVMLNRLQTLYLNLSAAPSGESDLPVLNLFSVIDQQDMSQYFTERVCEPGEIIVREGDPGDIMYVVRSGQTIVLKGELQNPKVLGIHGPGGIIGEMALLDNRPRSATVIAMEMVRLLCLNYDNFHQILNRFPVVSLQLLSILTARLRQADEERSQELLPVNDQTVQIIQELREQASRDALTGLYNRRYLEENLGQQVLRAVREGSSLSILMMDIDHFKHVNDTYGHPAGDKVLQTLAALLQSCIRVDDIPCRYGGEEFCVLMPGATIAIASERAEHIRQAIQDMAIHDQGQEIRVTLSVGVSAYPQHGSSGEELLACADRALYQAKGTGRNRVIVCG